jgi:putative polyketide hydroxylase
MSDVEVPVLIVGGGGAGKHREITAEGAVLVRPDRYIAWRSLGAVDNPYKELHHVFSRVVSRSDAEIEVAPA